MYYKFDKLMYKNVIDYRKYYLKNWIKRNFQKPLPSVSVMQ